MPFPTKEERSLCWGARDKYWECLDKQNDDSAQCKEFRKLYEQSCSAQWVKHFDRKRTYLIFKDKIEKDGYEPLEGERFKIIPSQLKTKSTVFQPRRIYHKIVSVF